MTEYDIIKTSERLLHPYRISEDCPYLSEDQRELSLLDMRERSAWMAEWLMVASLKPLRPFHAICRDSQQAGKK